MMMLGTQRVGPRGRLEIGGCDAVDLARTFGTPLYVIDELHVRENCRAYRTALEACCRYAKVMYASKALMTTAIARMVASEGLGVDVASGGELMTAVRAGVPARDLLFHGNYKSLDEMRLAIDQAVGRVVVDSVAELETWQQLAVEASCKIPVLLRANPNVKPKTHTSISVGQIDSKFGMSIQSGDALRAVRRALELDRINLLGLHCHIGSQVLGWQAFAQAAREIGEFAAQVRAETGYITEQINLGGGLGIRYVPEDQPPAIGDFVRHVVAGLLDAVAETGIPEPEVLMEPGRSIVGEAGLTLYTVGVVKDIPGVRTYVSVDGGLSDNPRPEMYDARYHVFLAERPEEPATQTVTVAGKHCETDTLFRDVALADPQPGDILAVQSTGAYNYAMASNYNRLPRPAMVLVREGHAEPIVRRETYDDLLRCDVLPERLCEQPI